MDASVNIETRGECCQRNCSVTFRHEHGQALSNGPFSGTNGEPGDVRCCEHGRIWGFAVSNMRIDQWELLSPLWTPVQYRRAVRALRKEVVVTEQKRHGWLPMKVRISVLLAAVVVGPAVAVLAGGSRAEVLWSVAASVVSMVVLDQLYAWIDRRDRRG